MNISDLMTQEGFSSFLQAYHQRLHAERSFPPLGVQKALHTASPIFGYKNWQAMSASTNWHSRQTQNQSSAPISVVVEFWTGEPKFDNPGSQIKCTLTEIFASDRQASEYLSILIEENPPCFLKDKQDNETPYEEVRLDKMSPEEIAECVEANRKVKVRINRLSEKAVSEAQKNPVIRCSFKVDYVGDHQSPYSESITFEGHKENVYMDMIDLFIQDIGAFETVSSLLRNAQEHKLTGYYIDEEAIYHPVTETELFRYLINEAQGTDKINIVYALRQAIGDKVFNKEEFADFFAFAASVEINDLTEEVIGCGDSIPRKETISENASTVADHVIEMQEKYGFQSDEDSVRGAVEESANLLAIDLTEQEIVEACDLVLKV